MTGPCFRSKCHVINVRVKSAPYQQFPISKLKLKTSGKNRPKMYIIFYYFMIISKYLAFKQHTHKNLIILHISSFKFKNCLLKQTFHYYT